MRARVFMLVIAILLTVAVAEVEPSRANPSAGAALSIRHPGPRARRQHGACRGHLEPRDPGACQCRVAGYPQGTAGRRQQRHPCRRRAGQARSNRRRDAFGPGAGRSGRGTADGRYRRRATGPRPHPGDQRNGRTGRCQGRCSARRRGQGRRESGPQADPGIGQDRGFPSHRAGAREGRGGASRLRDRGGRGAAEPGGSGAGRGAERRARGRGAIAQCRSRRRLARGRGPRC